MTAVDERVASSLPEYEIQGELGRGAMGMVLWGRHRKLDRQVAIKALPELFVDDPQVRVRFAQEARLLASLDHPHIVPVYDYVEDDGMCVLVMEHLGGGTVWNRMTATGYSHQEACAAVATICAALDYAHGKGVLHRDIKPENLMSSTAGLLKVVDFGIARIFGGGKTLATSNGDIVGTPAYMAPEQVEGTRLGPAADVYATGIVLYELLSGQLPFSAEGGPMSILFRRTHEDPIPLRAVAPEVPARVAEVTMAALERDPGERPQSAGELLAMVDEAACASWGADWFEATGTALMDQTHRVGRGGHVERAAENGEHDSSSTIATPRPPTPPPDDAPRPPEEPRPNGATVDPQPQRVRSVQDADARRVGQADVADLGSADLMPVVELFQGPRRPVLLGVAATVLWIATVAAGFATLGDEGPGAVEIDLAEPQTLPIGDVPPDATEARLDLEVAGLPLVGSATSTITRTADGGGAVTVDLSGNRYLAGGAVESELVFVGADPSTSRPGPTIVPAGDRWKTVPFAAAALLTLLVVSYAENLLRPLRRRGQRRVSAAIGMTVVGAGAGVAAVLAAWCLGSGVVEPSGLAFTAVVGMVAGLVTTLTVSRLGARARARRLQTAWTLGRTTATGTARDLSQLGATR